MSAPLKILLVTDSFPPLCGGSGWSTWELARGLMSLGHRVEVVKIDARSRTGVHERDYEGVRVTQFCRRTSTLPLARNFAKNERLWEALSTYLTERLRADRVDIVHGQHVMSVVPAIRAGAAAGVPAVATVRDYWPVCYWSDLIYDPTSPHLCPKCSATMMTRCIRPRAGAAFPAAWSAIPYMRANLGTKRRTLARSQAVIAVSHAIADDLRRRAPELAMTPLHTIPNPVDMAQLDDIYDAAAPPMPGPYVLYAGKLATNKGVQFLLGAYQEAGLTWPLVVVGDGPLKASLESDAKARGIPLRTTGWLGRAEMLAWMRHATVLAFPSYGPESLSRVLIEGAALGVAIAAMDTGGTRDILKPGSTALVSTDAAGLARDLATLAGDEALRLALGRAAREDVRGRFATPAVVARIEAVYRSLLPRLAA